jgi:DUF1016 N-terminal domain
MSKRVSKASKAVAALPADYAPSLGEIQARMQSARIKAGLATNRELLALHWEIGRLILDHQRKEDWGSRVINRLSADLLREFPGQQGFSPRNLKYMRAFSAQTGRGLSSLLLSARRATQRSIKFLRWLRLALVQNLAETLAVPHLRLLCARL